MKKLFLLFASLSILISVSSASLADFAFVQVSDTHTGINESAFNFRYNEVIRQVNGLKPAFVIHTGDALQGWSTENADLFKKLTSNIAGKVYISPGNHDIPDLANSGRDKAADQINAWKKSIGYDRISFTYENCVFIGLNSNLWNTKYPAEKEQFDWLKSELDKTIGKRIFIFEHCPLYLNTPNDKNGDYFAVDNPARRKLLNLFKTYHVEAVITGHYHRMIHTVYNGTSFITSPATSFSCAADQGLTGYMVYNIYPGGFSYRFADLRTTGSPPDFSSK